MVHAANGHAIVTAHEVMSSWGNIFIDNKIDSHKKKHLLCKYFDFKLQLFRVEKFERKHLSKAADCRYEPKIIK